MTDYADEVRGYLDYCRRAARELKLKGSALDPKYNPTEGGACKMIYHRTPAEAQEIRRAYKTLTGDADG